MSEEAVIESDVGGGESSGSEAAASTESGLGDFFSNHSYDDGGSGVVDLEGNSFLDKDGNKFRGPDALKKAEEYHRTNGQTAKPNNQQALPAKTGTVQAQNRVAAFEGFIDSNGKVNHDALSSTTQAFNALKRSYSTESFIKAQQGGARPLAQPEAPVDPIDALNKRVEDYKTQQHQIRVQPVIDHWNEVIQMYGGVDNVPEDVKNSVNALYGKQLQAVEKLAQAEDKKQRDNYLREFKNQKNPEEARGAYTKTFASVAQQYFKNADPNKSVQALENLILGKYDPATKKLVSPGYGTDYVDLLFKTALTASNKTFSSTQEWAKAYQEFFQDICADPGVLSQLARVSWDRFYATHQNAIRDNYRQAWESERRGATATQGIKPNSVASAMPESVESALSKWTQPPKPNM